jgi:flagellar basal-body rod modification protein FlgD
MINSATSATSGTSGTSGNTALGTTATKTDNAADPAAAQDRFLKLLVAQLNNQDPMNPMDNAQMTSQIAQINTVTGIQQLNDTVKGLVSQFSAQQMLHGAAMLGHDVLMPGSTLNIENGVAKGAIDLASSSDNVTINIFSPGGQLLESLNLGAKAEGRHTFEWDASAYQGQTVKFTVAASAGNQGVTSTPLISSSIESISNDNGLMKLNLKGGTSVSYNDVTAIL